MTFAHLAAKGSPKEAGQAALAHLTDRYPAPWVRWLCDALERVHSP